MRAHVARRLTCAALGTGDHLVAAQYAPHLVLGDFVALTSLSLAQQHRVEDVLVRRDTVGRPALVDAEPLEIAILVVGGLAPLLRLVAFYG